MKVSELIEKLQEADQDLEVTAAEMIDMPTMTLNDGDLIQPATMRTPSPFERNPIVQVNQMTSVAEEPNESYMVLGFERRPSSMSRREMIESDLVN